MSEYLYASARIRALETGLVGRERVQAMLELPDAAAAEAALVQAGVFSARDVQEKEREALLLALLKDGFDTVRDATKDPRLAAFLQYPYDCNNAKAILKSALRGTDPAPLLTDAGTVPAAALAEAMEKDDGSALPRHLAAAVGEAREAYAKTHNPQEIDFILDRACFLDMSEAAAPLPFARSYVACRADLVNITVCLRLLRMGTGPVPRATFERAFVPGGTLGAAWFAETFEAGEARLAELLQTTPYAGVLTGAGQAFSAVEKAADDCLMAFVKTAKFIPFGAEVAIAYLAGLETAVKNIRILLAGKEAGLDADTLRQRVRESYV